MGGLIDEVARILASPLRRRRMLGAMGGLMAGAAVAQTGSEQSQAQTSGPGRSPRDHVTGGGQSFTFLQPGFTQDLFGTANQFLGGVAFAPDGDPWVNPCGGSNLHRYDRQAVTPEINGTTLHPETIVQTSVGCGMVNHPNGSIYSNLGPGVNRLDPSTGAQTAGPFGPSGNVLGIDVDPVTRNLVYVGSNGTIFFVDPEFTTSGTFSTATTGNFFDGIAFEPTGDFLFLSNRTFPFRLTIVNRAGELVQHVPMTSEPDGISFHATTPKFVLTNNLDGTMTRFDFPNDDFTQTPTQTVFASGGFRGDLSQVGVDGCIYLTQNGTRYNDGTVTGENSLVRICGGFAPGAGIPTATPTGTVITTPTATATPDSICTAGGTCTNRTPSFPACTGFPDCICLKRLAGGRLCALGSTPCKKLKACKKDGTCKETGAICVTDSCCSKPKCVTPQYFCGIDASAPRAAAAPQPRRGEATLGRP